MRFSTAHKAKGLGFAHVYLAGDFLGKGQTPAEMARERSIESLREGRWVGEADTLSDPEALLGGELEEEVHVAYVAATRATACLYVGPGLDEWLEYAGVPLGGYVPRATAPRAERGPMLGQLPGPSGHSAPAAAAAAAAAAASAADEIEEEEDDDDDEEEVRCASNPHPHPCRHHRPHARPHPRPQPHPHPNPNPTLNYHPNPNQDEVRFEREVTLHANPNPNPGLSLTRAVSLTLAPQLTR